MSPADGGSPVSTDTRFQFDDKNRSTIASQAAFPSKINVD